MLIPSVIELNIVRPLVRGVDPEILRPANQKEFNSLVGSIRRENPGPVARLGIEDLALLIAMSVLTTQMNCSDDDLLPHCTALAGLVGAVPGDGDRRRIAVDCAIAYGCGWRRTLQCSREFGLDELWEKAFHLLVKQIMAAIGVANDRLKAILKPFLQAPGEMDLMDNLEDGCWEIASTLAFRLIRPLHSRHDAADAVFEITGNRGVGGAAVAEDAPSRDFSRVRGPDFALLPLPAGSRYVFDVVSGIAVATANGRVLAAGLGGRFVIRAGDFAAVEVSFPVGPNLGRLLRLDFGYHAFVGAVAGPVSLAQWECGCGSWACSERHRLASWLPDASIGLKDFVNSAINGRDFPLKPKALIAGMYYSYLSREGWGGETDSESTALPRIRRVLMVRSTKPVNPETHRPEEKQELRENFLLISALGNFGPVRVLRCDRCGKFRPANEANCDCGAAGQGGAPTAVWMPVPRLMPPPPANAPPPVPAGAVREFMSEFLKRWKESIDDADPGEQSAERNEEREIYQEVVEAFRQSDLVAAAELVEYARKKGWNVPEVEG